MMDDEKSKKATPPAAAKRTKKRKIDIGRSKEREEKKSWPIVGRIASKFDRSTIAGMSRDLLFTIDDERWH